MLLGPQLTITFLVISHQIAKQKLFHAKNNNKFGPDFVSNSNINMSDDMSVFTFGIIVSLIAN